MDKWKKIGLVFAHLDLEGVGPALRNDMYNKNMKEYYIIDHSLLSKSTAAMNICKQWVIKNLCKKDGFCYDEKDIEDFLAATRKDMSKQDADAIRDLPSNLQSKEWQVVDIGLNSKYEICRVSIAVALPSKKWLWIKVSLFGLYVESLEVTKKFPSMPLEREQLKRRNRVYFIQEQEWTDIFKSEIGITLKSEKQTQ
jgi:hypothetical protein